MERFYSVFVWTLLFVACGAIGCGSKQPTKDGYQPKVTLPEARACPDLVAGQNVQMSTSIVESNAPVIFPTGDKFVVAWNDLHGRSSDVFMVRIDKKGVVQGISQKLANTGKAQNQTLTGDGEDTVLVWNDSDLVKSVRFGTHGEKPRTISQSGIMPAAGPWGAVAWVEKGTLLFISDGMKPSSKKGSADPVPVAVASGRIEDLQIAYNGSFYALVWSSPMKNGRQIRLQRVSPDGKKLGALVRVSSLAGISENPVVVWDGNRFVVAWINGTPSSQNSNNNYRIFIAVVPDMGDMPTLTRRMEFVSSENSVGLAATGKEYAITWVSQINKVTSSVYLQRLNLAGNPIGTVVEVTDSAPTICGSPRLAWTGDGYGVVWHDDRTQTGTEVYFAFVGCTAAIDAKSSSEPVDPTPAK
jgi:hypothetical protein